MAKVSGSGVRVSGLDFRFKGSLVLRLSPVVAVPSSAPFRRDPGCLQQRLFHDAAKLT